MNGAGTRQLAAQFAELICADDQWLHDEFNALIAASYQPPSPPRPAPPRTPPLPPGQPRKSRPLPVPRDRPTPGAPAHKGLHRQRSPPPPR